MEKYKISEFAGKMGVSIDFIRYYEKAGLIQAIVNPKNNYHYYETTQAENVMQILYCRSFGFSSAETVKLLRDTSPDELKETLEERLRSVRRETRMLRHIDREICQLQHTAEHIPDGAWYIVQAPAIYFLACSFNNELTGGITASVLDQWNKAIPCVKNMTRWVVKLRPDGEPEFTHREHGRYILKEDAAALPLSMPEGIVREVPSYRCLEYHAMLPHSSAYHAAHPQPQEKFSPAFDILLEHHFRIQGDIYSRVVYFVNIDGQIMEHQVLHIPLAM